MVHEEGRSTPSAFSRSLSLSLSGSRSTMKSMLTCAIPMTHNFTKASSGSEGGSSRAMGAMRQAQTAGYGVLPPPATMTRTTSSAELAMANTFMAQAYDLDDKWSGDRGPCVEIGWNTTSPLHNCCGKGANGSAVQGCESGSTADIECANMCAAQRTTTQYMGGIHPRSKKPVGERLAKAAFNTIYGGLESYTGPTLAGCSVDAAGAGSLTVRFDAKMLRGDTVVLQKYNVAPNFTP